MRKSYYAFLNQTNDGRFQSLEIYVNNGGKCETMHYTKEETNEIPDKILEALTENNYIKTWHYDGYVEIEYQWERD